MTALALSADRIDLWLASSRLPGADLLERYRRLLSDEERARASRFHFESDRQQFVVTRALVRTVLSRYGATDPAAWQFTANKFGKPEVAGDTSPERALSFNVSHAADLIVLAVTCRHAIGIDIEAVRAGRASLDVARRYFSPQEVAALIALPEPLRAERFFEYWTLKESYIKAAGSGLSTPLDSFGFDLAAEHIVFSPPAQPLSPRGGDWRFWQLRFPDDYVVAVCAWCADGVTPSLSLRRIVPLSTEEQLPHAVLRQSS